MARYYEETALIEFVKQYTPHINGETTMKCVERAIREAPTADVVPKSEVAKEFTCFVGDPHKVEHCPYLDEIEKAKTEVAREIIDHIDGWFMYCENYSGNIIKNRLAELKKKYTEGKE